MRNPDNWPVDESTVKSVEEYDDGGWSVTQENGWTFGVTKEEAEGKPAPVVGEKIVLLGGFGYQIRGIFIGDREYRYVTKDEAESQRQRWLADYDRKKKENFYANIADWIKRKNDLAKPFRDRLDRFAAKGFEEFWTEDSGYELFVCEQAHSLLYFAPEEGRVEWLHNFRKADWEDQKKLFPALNEGHSGNTFAGMVRLAITVAEGRDI